MKASYFKRVKRSMLSSMFFLIQCLSSKLTLYHTKNNVLQ